MNDRLPLFIYQAKIAGEPLCVSGGAANHEGFGLCLYLDEDEVIQGLSIHKAYGSEKQECVGTYGEVPWQTSPSMRNPYGGMYSMDVYKASRDEPTQRVVARLRESMQSGDETATEVYLRILGER